MKVGGMTTDFAVLTYPAHGKRQPMNWGWTAIRSSARVLDLARRLPDAFRTGWRR